MTVIPEDLTAAGWTIEADGKAIAKTFRFKGFRAAIAWMVQGAFEAEEIDHHPEWRNVYNRVEVRLTSHDTGGLTDRDIDLAQRLEALSR